MNITNTRCYLSLLFSIATGILTTQAVAESLNVNGNATINGNLDLINNQIHNLGAPSNPQDAATKAYVDALNPTRVISLPVETAVINNDAAYELHGGGDLSGMAFPNSGFPRFSTGFTLPFDYTDGDDIKVYITWGNSRFNAISCGVRLRSNGVTAFRPNTHWIYQNGVFTGDINYDGSEVTLAMPDTPEQIRQTLMTIPGTTTSNIPIYQPGDNIVIRLARDSNDSTDTCTGKLYILAMYATY
ncbi:hypothetical protein [Thiolapillus sp.]